MADTPPHRRTGDPSAGTPRWVKVFGVIAVVVVVLLLVVLIVGGDHGPGRHGAAVGSNTPS